MIPKWIANNGHGVHSQRYHYHFVSCADSSRMGMTSYRVGSEKKHYFKRKCIHWSQRVQVGKKNSVQTIKVVSGADHLELEYTNENQLFNLNTNFMCLMQTLETLLFSEGLACAVTYYVRNTPSVNWFINELHYR